MKRALHKYFYFHVRDGDDLIPDREGLELPDLKSVQDECRRLVRGVLNEEQFRTELIQRRQFEIVDELGNLVLTIPFMAVMLQAAD